MTLFAADRAKAIKTKAVVNESPTEKLIRELREENQRLLDQLKGQGPGQPIVIQGEPGEPQMVGISEDGALLCKGAVTLDNASCVSRQVVLTKRCLVYHRLGQPRFHFMYSDKTSSNKAKTKQGI